MKRVLLGLTLLALSGCVWSPTNRSTRESTDTLWLYGESNAAGQSIDLSAQNPHTGVVSIVGHATSATSMDSYGLYPWVATFTPPANFWAPQLGRGLAHSPGRVEITTQVHGDPFLFRTFSPAAQACTINAINAGQSALAAGNSCSDGTSLVVFDTNGVGNSTAPTPSTAWIADTAFFPVTTVPPGIVGGVPAQWQLGHYRMYATDDPSGSIDVYGVVCRPIAGPGVPGQLKTVIINHGGYGGVEDIILNTCLLSAHSGWLAAASGYRFEGVTISARPESGPAISRPKDLTRVEIGLGEVTDVLRLTEIVRARTDVATSKMLMWGHSHGAAITLRAVELGVQVNAAAAFSPPTDFASWWAYCSTGVPTVGPGCTSTDEELTASLGGTPTTLPVAYRWRSPTFFASDLSARRDIKVLVLQGDADPLVHPSQACGLAQAAWVVPALAYSARYVGGGLSPPSDCAGTSLTWQYTPPTAWPGERHLVVYAGATHDTILVGAPWTDFLSFVQSLAF